MNQRSAALTMEGLLEGHAEARPGDIAIFEHGHPNITWRELVDSVASLGALLRSLSLDHRDTVALLLAGGPAPLIAMLGSLPVCGCAPMDPALTPAEILSELRASNLSAIIIDSANVALQQIILGLGVPVILADGLTFTLASYSPPSPLTSRPPGQPLIDPLAILLRTSATTGRSKLVPLTWSNLHAIIANTQSCLTLNTSDRALLLAHPFHILGVISPICQLLAGGSVIAPRGHALADFPTILRDLRPTWYACGPTTHRAILAHLPADYSTQHHSLRFIRSGGAPIPPDLRVKLAETFRVPLIDVYGLTEVGAIASCGWDDKTPHGSVGRSAGLDIAILDVAGCLLPPGQQGEIVVRGPAVMHAYADDPEGNAAAFHDGWFGSGDLGHLDERGYLFLTGRLKEIINRGGQKIIPDEIDAVLAAHPAILEVAAFAIPHPTLGEDVACAVVLRPGANLSANDLRDFARPSLASYKIPRLIRFLPVLPRGSTGKPKRLELTQLASSSQPTEASLEDNFADLQRTEMYITNMWCEILNLPHVDANNDFFLLGGDSLAAVAMLARLDKEFHFDQPLSAERFLEAPTVAGLTNLLDRAAENCSEHTPNSIVHPLPATGQNPLYLIPANSQTGLYFLRLARHLGSPLAVSVVRPLERGPFNPLFYVEEAAQQAVDAILAAQPAGPYVLGGFCAGGVIAAETASRLERIGHAVRLILFDTPNSALPPVFSRRDLSANFYTAKVRSYVAHSVSSRSLRPFANLLRAAARRGTWALIRKLRPLLQRVYKVRSQDDKLLWSPTEVAFYVPSVSNFDILHVIAVTEENAFRDHSRFAWQRFTRGVMTVEYITTDHDSFFVEANLPAIANAVRTWLTPETGS